jgi:hypothetical protein
MVNEDTGAQMPPPRQSVSEDGGRDEDGGRNATHSPPPELATLWDTTVFRSFTSELTALTPPPHPPGSGSTWLRVTDT